MDTARSLPHIPDHEMIRKIGSGAYGEVWLARTVMGGWRAVKIVRREDFSEDITFQREFEGIRHYEPIARNHPGLVHILHVGKGETPSPFYYYVMELGDDLHAGQNIDEQHYIPRTLQTDKKIANGTPLSLDYVLEIGIQLSEALAYLHSKGLTHRDIKPANIIFVNNRPKLADVGLVAQLNQMTFVGTEGFIPHEGPGTPRADVYALGKVLYEITTGKDRLCFPELPDILPAHIDRKTWLSLNNVICSACAPRLEHCSISEAKHLSAQLKAIKQGKNIVSNLQKKKSHSLFFLLLSFGILILTFMAVSFFLVQYFKPKTAVLPPIETKSQGQLIITTQPSGALIYDSKGNYVDETPYGPISLPVGTEVQFTLKKEGFKDWSEKGIIRSDKTLGIGGQLIAFSPPLAGKNWIDSAGHVYLPGEDMHLSQTPISLTQIQKFFKEQKDATDKPVLHAFHVPKEGPAPEFTGALITYKQALEYAEWLTKESLKQGLLQENQSITPLRISEWRSWKRNAEDEKKSLNAFLLKVGETRYVAALIDSVPSGATLILNGITIGKTPFSTDKLTPGHYSLIFKHQGYAKLEVKGVIAPHKKFVLKRNLPKDGSVEFGKNWTNGLGMTFVPITPHLSAAQYETAWAHYNLYLKEQGLNPIQQKNMESGPNFPAASLSREEARDFARWLTLRDQQAGLLELTDRYRLPSDQEWTLLAGGVMEEGRYPSERHLSTYEPGLEEKNTEDLFPWGNSWPPPPKYGNFSGLSSAKERNNRIIADYNDDFPKAAPTGSFSPNKYGLYDISGNVWEWVDDDFGGEKDFKFKDYHVARGGGWPTYKPSQLLTRYRIFLPPNTKEIDVGFRLVLAREQERFTPQEEEYWEEEESLNLKPQTQDFKPSDKKDSSAAPQPPSPSSLPETSDFSLPFEDKEEDWNLEPPMNP